MGKVLNINLRAVRDQLQPGGEPEAAAVARFALDAGLAAHHVDQAMGDGEADAGAAELDGRVVAPPTLSQRQLRRIVYG